MKYLKSFEAIISPKVSNGFLKEIESLLRRNRSIPVSKVKEIANKYDIEFVDYDTFYNELPDYDKHRAPKKNWKISLFGLVNPISKKVRIVCSANNIDFPLFGWIRHIVEHESVHVGQQSKRTWDPPYLPNPSDREEYFNNKDEVMAFSQSI